MNLYWKSLFGGLKSTSKFEEILKKKEEDYERYLKIDSSKELEEYKQLKEKVNASYFRNLKHTLVSRKYKDTQEYRDLKKYSKLESNKDLKLYFEVLRSSELAEYISFKQTPEFIKLLDSKSVKSSEKLTRLKQFEKSKEFKVYNRFHDSYIDKEYLELHERVNNTEFKRKNEFWINPRRWETTKEYEIECRFRELEEREDIQFYLKYQKENPEKAGYHKILDDTFDESGLDAKLWEIGFHVANASLKKNYSFLNEKQGNNAGDNITAEKGSMHIVTKREKCETIAWNKKTGFQKKEYDFTSGVINSLIPINSEEGAVSAKVRFSGDKSVVHSISLKGENKTPHITICRCENDEIEVGAYFGKGEDTIYISNNIRGIDSEKFYIYTLVWNECEIIWYINNVEIFRTANYQDKENMYVLMNSFIPENNTGGDADFEIDYIKVYSKK